MKPMLIVCLLGCHFALAQVDEGLESTMPDGNIRTD